MRLMSSANDLFEWIVTSSQLNDVFVIRTVILHRSFHSLLWSIRSTLSLLWSCQCPKGNPQSKRRRSPRSHPADQRFSTTTTSKTPGSSSFSAGPRKQMRQTPNFRMYATVAPRDCLRIVRQSPQLAIQKVACPAVGKVSRGCIVVFPVMAGESMTLSRIAVQRRIWFLGKCRFNLRLCSLRNELILLGQMHENGRMKPIDLSQVFVSIGAVIPDRGVDAVVAHGRHEDHQRAEAIAEQCNFTAAFRETARCVN